MPERSYSDEYIIRQVQKGDVELYGLIVRRYQDRIFSIGMRFFYDRDDSADFAQEVFLKAFSKIDTFRELARFRFWLVRIAYNHAINIKKGNRISDVEIDDNNVVSEYIQPDKGHLKREVKEILDNEIRNLPERYRVCIDLYFYMGLKYIEISEITGYPVNTIKSDVLRAKKILRHKLKGTIAEEYHEM